MKTVQSIPRPSLSEVDKPVLSQATANRFHPSTPRHLESADMSLVLCVAVLLSGFPLGKTFVLHPSPEASSSSAVKNKRCRGELEIRKILLESLSLQQEPRVSVSQMNLLRHAFKNSISSSPGNSTFPEDSANSTCCTYSSQVFMKDLGWERWVVYPESVTFVQCRSCGSSLCAERVSASASAQCCKPTAHNIVPFVYVDERSSLVLSSVSLTRECGCDPGDDPQESEVMTPAQSLP
ncbi:uncharacterized protein LOC120481940 isoform X2 [Pimephales promelas]|uniref:uncharacterized protein LOC120481940 isoform X2 n=1 Tax=Pimephales promelas TaxID=90988 RepID=UPI001955EFD3|nr:uncharacterized protein LOC120481940 isoform X2 [Pimephales promelas]